jgi:hypothetical protein
MDQLDAAARQSLQRKLNIKMAIVSLRLSFDRTAVSELAALSEVATSLEQIAARTALIEELMHPRLGSEVDPNGSCSRKTEGATKL